MLLATYAHMDNCAIFLTEQALASAPVNPAYAMNEAYTSDNKEMDDAIKVVDNQDAKLTENVY